MSGKVKPKNGMNYLPWASAWAYIKEYFPRSSYTVVRDDNGNLYHTDGKTCWVETLLSINGETQEEQLAIMDNRNKSVSADWSYVKKKYKLNMPFLRLAYPAKASAFSSNAA